MTKVIVFEDNDDLRALLRMALERDGHHVESFPDVRNVVDTVVAVDPDVILMDLRMPGVDGEEAIVKLRADARTADAPVILVSADHRAAAVASRLGVVHVDKPFPLTELRHAITRVRDPLS